MEESKKKEVDCTNETGEPLSRNTDELLVKPTTIHSEEQVPVPMPAATPPEFELSPSRIKSAKVGTNRFRYNKPKSV